MTGPLYHIGRFCSRHHWPVIATWIVFVAVLVASSHMVGEKTSDNLNLPGTGSTRATDLLQNRLPDQAYGSNPTSSSASALLSKGKTEGYIPVTLDVSQGDLTKDEAQAVLDAAQPARDA